MLSAFFTSCLLFIHLTTFCPTFTFFVHPLSNFRQTYTRQNGLFIGHIFYVCILFVFFFFLILCTSLFSIFCPLFYKYSLYGAYALIFKTLCLHITTNKKYCPLFFYIYFVHDSSIFCPLLVHLLLSILLFSCIVLYFLFIEWSTFLFFVLLFAFITCLFKLGSQEARPQGYMG